MLDILLCWLWAAVALSIVTALVWAVVVLLFGDDDNDEPFDGGWESMFYN